MRGKKTLSYPDTVILLLLSICLIPPVQEQNHAPEVKIKLPKSNAVVDVGATVNYEITVADKEDGNSAYDEINIKEVLLEVRQISAKAAFVPPDPPAITIMRTSNCFNCHNFNSKSIGPSFYEISKRYRVNSANIDTMVKRIKVGSSEVWGKEKMPAHSELSGEAIKTTANWVLKHAADPATDYYIGSTGTFRPKKPGHYMLIASYLDHGLKTAPGKQRLKGSDVIYIDAR